MTTRMGWLTPTTSTRGDILSIYLLTLHPSTGVSRSLNMFWWLFSAATLEHAPLEVVYIYFDTATYDEIERDEKVMETFLHFFLEIFTHCSVGNDFKVTMEAQLGLIGGTMGLLTGFSILSGVEIIYYLLRFSWFLLTTFHCPGSFCPSRPQELRWWRLSKRDLKIIWQERNR